MSKRILVLGPTGTQGFPVCTELTKKGFQVRAFELAGNPKIPVLEAMGIEVVNGDLLDIEDLKKAMEGMWGLFFLPVIPSSDDPSREIQVGKNVIQAAEEAGIEYMVHTSVDRAGEHETFVRWGEDFWPGYYGYWKGKSAVVDLVKACKILHWTILKPAYMMDCFIPPKAWGMYPDLKKGIVASARTPETTIPSFCGDDMGTLVAKVFEDFGSFEHKEIPLASDVITMDKAGAAIAKATGKNIKVAYQTREELIANGGNASVIDAQEWDIVNGYRADVEQTRALGVKLSTFEEWCVRHKDDFDIE